MGGRSLNIFSVLLKQLRIIIRVVLNFAGEKRDPALFKLHTILTIRYIAQYCLHFCSKCLTCGWVRKNMILFLSNHLYKLRGINHFETQAENSSSLYLIFVSSSASVSQVSVVSEMLKKKKKLLSHMMDDLPSWGIQILQKNN